MLRILFCSRFLVASIGAAFALIVTVLLVATIGSQPAAAAIEPGPGKGWLTIASRTKAEDAIAIARSYSQRFPGAVVFSSSNGYFGVSLGWADIGEATPLLERLKASGAVPSDSYFTAGARFLEPIWTVTGAQSYDYQQFLYATRLDFGSGPTPSAPPAAPQFDPMPPRSGVVAGLDPNGDNFLSLRSGPGTGNPEIARMLAGTSMTVTGRSGSWYKVTLSNGMAGWAFSRYVAFADIPVVGPGSQPTREAGGGEVPTVGPDEPAKPSQSGGDGEVASNPPPGIDTGDKPKPPAVIGDQRRVALVIGNSSYQNTTELPNPKNDAAAIASKLESLGFEVITDIDGTKAGMESAVRNFVKILPESNVALFFYAGHAMQVNGRNYLIPVDAKLEDSTAIDFETIDLGVVLDFMNTADRISILLLDACRDNPLARRFARSFSATRSAFIGRGLAAPSAAAGEVLIGFATAPGEVALDGDGANSPFTTALLQHIDEKDVDIEIMLKRVRQDVYRLTNQAQEPWVNSALRREFQFNPE